MLEKLIKAQEDSAMTKLLEKLKIEDFQKNNTTKKNTKILQKKQKHFSKIEPIY